MKKPPPQASPHGQGSSDSGGFLRNAPLPQRLMQTQQQQAQKQAELTKRMERAAESLECGISKKKTDMSRRRKSRRKSIWSMVRDNRTTTNNDRQSTNSASSLAKMDTVSATCPSCRSEDVVSIGSNTSRNQDLKKGETWGMKGREDEVLLRLQCQKCARVWTEET
mmetsp:Transcript_19596/g.45830  ORF Transcript_19596/g.45830 Transcript_19596/m.45830 type:complete len:166 (-) Transcript_19596:89-586(-)